MISDQDFFDWLVTNASKIKSRDEEVVFKMIKKTIRIKIDHVTGDVRESGKRLLLNYGHTLGHAIEMTTMNGNVEKYRHGEGVAIGMVAATYIAEKFLGTYQSVGEQLKHVLKLYDLPTRVISSDDMHSECLEIVNLDKKRKDNQLRLILVDEIGSAGVYGGVPFDLISDAFNEVINYHPGYGI
jgi:3-dehydroquinate synthase